MRRHWKLALGLAVFTLWLAAFVVVNHGVIAKPQDIERVVAPNLAQAGETLDLVTWNLGYGGLGAGSDFIADGGAHAFPPSIEAVRVNARGIQTFLASQDAEIVLLEELAHGGPVNYWVNLKRHVDGALAGRDQIFFPDFKTRLMPWPLAMAHGQGVYSRVRVESTDVVSLPAEDSGIFGVRRRYGATVARLAGPSNWTIITTHLAAFDKDARVRTQQLRALLTWADREYRRGRHVVIGGDFNLQLVDTHFPNTTLPKYLFWIFPFPREALLPGWHIAADPLTPSVRTNERPYRRGENYTTIIDGFLVSPNVAVEQVNGVDLDFQYSDHNPVHARVRALP